ncbi:uncharacterized protein LOC135607838 isoform X4 [Musa acuminata AAA Group]|uniref:uncharacterized protein LOC135607838 isoform X4 n=1 Tax=Musa acuminata AAA Group TaxID=214697 RepID=UPI0031E2B05B
MGRINITRTRSPSVHTPLYQKLKVLKPLRLCVTPSTVTGGCLSATSSFDCEQGETTVKPLEGGPGRKITQEEDEPVKNTATVLYIGHIPHGFYEEQMEGFFKQFGKIKHLRIACNRKENLSIMDSLNLKTQRLPKLWLMRFIIIYYLNTTFRFILSHQSVFIRSYGEV